MIDQDFLSDEENPAGRLETLDVERAVRQAELHQVDAGQVAGRVIQEHVLRARVRGIDPPRVRAGMPVIDGRVVLHARIAAVPGPFGHLGHHFAGLPTGAGTIGLGHPMGLPRLVFDHGLHELVGDAHREVRVLEEDRAIGFAVEVRLVAILDQDPRLLLFLGLALDEFHHVRVPDLDRLHLGRATRFAAALDHGRDLVEDPHERQRARRLAAARELLAVRTQRRQVRPRPRAKLEQHGLAARELHDVFHAVIHALDEAGRALRVFVRVFRAARLPGLPRPSASCTATPSRRTDETGRR